MDYNKLIIWLILASFVAFYLIIGYLSKHYSRTFPMFAKAQGARPVWMIGLGTAAAMVSANLFVGVPGWAYTYGYSAGWWILGNTLIKSLSLIFFTRYMFRYYQANQFKFNTPSEWFGSFFQSRALRVLISASMLCNVYFIAGQNIAMATILEQLSSIPYEYGIIFSAVIVVTYSLMGGQYASLTTDMVQWFVKCASGFLILASIFYIFGSNAPWVIHESLKAQDPSLISALAKNGIFSDWISLLCIEFFLFTTVLQPHVSRMFMSLTDESQLKKYLWWACSGFVLTSSLMWLGGLAARVMYPNLAHPDSAIIIYILNNFNPLLCSIMIGGIMAAIFSVTDSMLMAIGTNITNDLLPSRFKTVLVTRIAIVLLGIISITIGLKRPESLMMVTQVATTAITSGIAALSFYALLGSRRLPSWLSCTVFIVGIGAYLFLSIAKPLPINIYKMMAISTAFSFITLFAGLAIARCPLREKFADT